MERDICDPNIFQLFGTELNSNSRSKSIGITLDLKSSLLVLWLCIENTTWAILILKDVNKKYLIQSWSTREEQSE